MDENTRRKLEALQPKSKAARLREWMPVIEQKLAEGVQVAQIAQALTDEGLVLSAATLSNYVYRYRKKKAGRPAAQGRQPQADAAPAAPQPPAGEAVSFEDALDTRKRDQIAESYLNRRKPIFGTKGSGQ
jgi:hypothetical protein